MNPFPSEDPTKTTLAKLNALVNSDSWVVSVMSFSPEDFDFLAKSFDGEEAAEIRNLVMEAVNVTLFADLVPYPREASIELEMLSKIYGNILKLAKVTNLEPTAAEKAKLDKFHNLLYATETEKDLVTGAEKTTVVASPLQQAYRAKMEAYQDAAMVYNRSMVAASTSDDAAVVLDFALNAPRYRQQVRDALAAWTTDGYKDEVETMEAYIARVTGRAADF